MYETIGVLLIAASLYPLGIVLITAFSDWKVAAKQFPRIDSNVMSWTWQQGVRVGNFLLRNSGKVGFTDSTVVLSGIGLRQLLTPQIEIPYRNIRTKQEGFRVVTSCAKSELLIYLDSDASKLLRAKIKNHG
jgi:hypothetical protein